MKQKASSDLSNQYAILLLVDQRENNTEAKTKTKATKKAPAAKKSKGKKRKVAAKKAPEEASADEKKPAAKKTSPKKKAPSRKGAVQAPPADLFDRAVDVAFERGAASSVLISRKLGIGYARARTLMDDLVAQGILGEITASGARPLLVSREEWDARS